MGCSQESMAEAITLNNKIGAEIRRLDQILYQLYTGENVHISTLASAALWTPHVSLRLPADPITWRTDC